MPREQIARKYQVTSLMTMPLTSPGRGSNEETLKVIFYMIPLTWLWTLWKTLWTSYLSVHWNHLEHNKHRLLEPCPFQFWVQLCGMRPKYLHSQGILRLLTWQLRTENHWSRNPMKVSSLKPSVTLYWMLRPACVLGNERKVWILHSKGWLLSETTGSGPSSSGDLRVCFSFSLGFLLMTEDIFLSQAGRLQKYASRFHNQENKALMRRICYSSSFF